MVAASPLPSAVGQVLEEEVERLPLAPSDSSNGDNFRKPRSKEITSRYKSSLTTAAVSTPSSSSARRFPSPNIGRAANGSDAPKRAVSAERRRPATPDSKASSSSRPGTPSTDARPSFTRPGIHSAEPSRSTKRLWPAAHNLSVSVQSDSVAGLMNGKIDSKERREGAAFDHTLKPTANGVQRSVDLTNGAQRKPTPERKGTPERKRTPLRRSGTDQTENARPLDNGGAKTDVKRWPNTNSSKIFGSAMSRSVDLGADKQSTRTSSLLVQGRVMNGVARPVRPAPPIRSLTRSINEGPMPDSPQSVSRHMISESRGRGKEDAKDESGLSADETTPRKSTQSGIVVEYVRQLPEEADLASSEGAPSVDNFSDCDSISSGSSVPPSLSMYRNGRKIVSSKTAIKGTNVPARFWQDGGNGRSRRLSEGDRMRSSMSESELSTVSSTTLIGKSRRPKLPLLGASSLANNVATSPWSLSPGRPTLSVSQHPPSPSAMTRSSSSPSPFRGMPSPSKSRSSAFQLPPSGPLSTRANSVSGMLSFGVDIRKGKKAMSQQEEAQFLRIMHNRFLQWRFVNARADATMNSQKTQAERSLYNAWIQTSELRKSVAMKRIKLQQARQTSKINSILLSQGVQLEDWAALQVEHSTALTGAMQSLEAAILRVPVTGGARADVPAIREALGYGVDVMNSIESSGQTLVPKAEKMAALLMELSKVAAEERAALEDCGNILDRIAAFEIEERSLRTHFVQLEYEKSRSSARTVDIGVTESVPIGSP